MSFFHNTSQYYGVFLHSKHTCETFSSQNISRLVWYYLGNHGKERESTQLTGSKFKYDWQRPMVLKTGKLLKKRQLW